MSDTKKFPQGFFWGAAMAGHQVEGGSTNDWSRWETSAARRKALDDNGLAAKYGHDTFVSGPGIDFWNRYAEDIKAAADMGLTMLRISVEWSRVEPREGEFDQSAIDRYVDMVRVMRAHNIEPMVTLWHWPIPQWRADVDGWETSTTPEAFARFVSRIVPALTPHVRWWITLNEPENYASITYLQGKWPPQKKNPFAFIAVMVNHVRAHRIASSIIHEHRKDAMVGIAKHDIWFEPVLGVPLEFWNRTLAFLANFFWNDLLTHLVAPTSDFIGINSYFHERIDGWLGKKENKVVSDMGWELHPDSLYHVVKNAAKHGKPILVTEHGLADEKDTHRPWYIKESLAGLAKAINEGADVRGYLHWSLLDNFEWSDGYWPKFGLIAVDRKSFTRTARGSAKVYSDLIKEL